MSDFSPSQTELYLDCPTLWYLQRHWEPITGEWTPHLVIGRAISRGLEHWINNQDLDNAQEKARAELAEGFEENDNWTMNALEKLVDKGIKAATETTLKDIVESEEIIGTELEIGNGRIDLLTKKQDTLIITDHKTALQVKDYYLEKRLLESETSWQLWDYAARVVSMYDPPHIAIRYHLGVLTPRTKWHVHGPIELKKPLLERWALGRDKVWDLIEKDTVGPDLPTVMNLRQCNNRYGRCHFYDACHTCGLDREKMKVFYQEKQR